MLKTIKLYGVLAEQFGHQFKLDVSSTREAIRALSVLLPGFEKFMLHAHERGLGFAIFLDEIKGHRSRGKKQPYCYDSATNRRITGRNVAACELDMMTESSVIKIVPRVMGAGGNNGILQVVLGVVLIVAGFWTGGATSNIGVALIGAGAGMLVGGIAQMLMPSAETQDQNQDGNRANKGFGSAVTTIAQGNPVPILRGEREIGGFIASAGQFTEDLM
ncbi:tail assembly protein [Acinetobacter ursingii]|uniref:Tail assembly protein n=1 Tax=Acinetobacter ursingii TaxID=108980 RepID=A0AA46NVK8_9GAMM|nr:tail assembly protein [Acinetobacter ursingii]THD29754.1 MAG: tail assembly protein [Flavobacterium johnsoniae]UYF76657.1 tail assembly protein [Acinetobacter ursingii]